MKNDLGLDTHFSGSLNLLIIRTELKKNFLLVTLDSVTPRSRSVFLDEEQFVGKKTSLMCVLSASLG